MKRKTLKEATDLIDSWKEDSSFTTIEFDNPPGFNLVRIKLFVSQYITMGVATFNNIKIIHEFEYLKPHTKKIFKMEKPKRIFKLIIQIDSEKTGDIEIRSEINSTNGELIKEKIIQQISKMDFENYSFISFSVLNTKHD